MRLPAIRRREQPGQPDLPVTATSRLLSARRNVTVAAVLALTAGFVGGAAAMAVGLLPAQAILGSTGIELGVALLFVLVAETVRAVVAGRQLRISRGKSPGLGAWQPGIGEG